MAQHIGLLTSGGDCPGLNAAIRAVVKAAREGYGMRVIGFEYGFRGLVQDQWLELDDKVVSGILTGGGTILGTSRDKPHKMMIGGKTRDMTDAIVDTYHRHHLDALVCMGGGGTQKNALRLKKAGLNIVTLPKTIDNDLPRTDRSFGFDTALGTATDAIDKLHSTATSHNRIIVLEVMGHRAGWLALGAGLAGGADVILIPEIPYDVDVISDAIRERTRRGKRFSIVAVAEGAISEADGRKVAQWVGEKTNATNPKQKETASTALREFYENHAGHTIRLTRQLEKLTGLESRLTILGHLQRGGTPSAGDRVFATWLGAHCAKILESRTYGVMLALQNGEIRTVPLEEVAGKKSLVPPQHPLVTAARRVGASFGEPAGASAR